MLRDRFQQWGINDKNKKARGSSVTNTSPSSKGNQSESPADSLSLESPVETQKSSCDSSFVKIGQPSSGSSSFASGLPRRDSVSQWVSPEGETTLGDVDAIIPARPYDPSIASPIATAVVDRPARRALASVDAWYDTLGLTLANPSLWSQPCPFVDMMSDCHKAFYFRDTGARKAGNEMLHLAGQKVDTALRSSHPGVILQLLRSLSVKKLADRTLSDQRGSTSNCEVAVMLDGRLRIIECDGCDRSIARTHYHCGICNNAYDLCRRCYASGKHCYKDDHLLVKRLIVDGIVIESHTETRSNRSKPAGKVYTRSISQDLNSGKALVYANDSGTSRDAMPLVVRLLRKRALEILGQEHPFTLLLAAFEACNDWQTLCEHVIRLTHEKLVLGLPYTVDASMQAQLQVFCAEIHVQQGRHHELESLFISSWPNLASDLNATFVAEMMRLLAMSRAEQGRCDEAQNLLDQAYQSLCEAGQGQTRLSDRVLRDSAYINWQLRRFDDCLSTLDRLEHNLLFTDSTLETDKRFLLTLRNAVLLQTRRDEDAAELRRAFPEVFNAS